MKKREIFTPEVVAALRTYYKYGIPTMLVEDADRLVMTLLSHPQVDEELLVKAINICQKKNLSIIFKKSG